MQTSSAVELAIFSSPVTLRRCGATSPAGSRAKLISEKPITAFQKPIVVHGSVNAKSSSIAPPVRSRPAEKSVAAISASSAAELPRTRAAKADAPPAQCDAGAFLS